MARPGISPRATQVIDEVLVADEDVIGRWNKYKRVRHVRGIQRAFASWPPIVQAEQCQREWLVIPVVHGR
jgi:hypothetical protein